jgi:hypothetical protein
MNKFFILLFCAAPAMAGAPKYAPVGGATAVPLSRDSAYFRTPGVKAPDYWNLSSFYVPQFNGYACSAASVSMALNALLNTGRGRTDAEENISQQDLLQKAGGFGWKDLLSDGGLNGRHGVTLAQLGQAVSGGLAAYGAQGYTVEVTTVTAATPEALKAFRAALAANERDPRNIMLLHFVQDAVTGAPGGPFAHVSPVGAYDARTRRVLIMDVDRQWYEPYWAADTAVLEAMARKTAAFGSGGYVVAGRNK